MNNANDLARATEQRACLDIGVREIPAKSNAGPRVEEYQATVSLPVGSPYCAAAVSTWVAEASAELNITPTFKRSGSAIGLIRNNPTLLFQELTPEAIPCVAIQRHADGVHGHAWLAIGLDQATGVITSLEANTNPQGSRDGGGVYVLAIRNVNDPTLATFIRIA